MLSSFIINSLISYFFKEMSENHSKELVFVFLQETKTTRKHGMSGTNF